jgi:outer membrane lipopolysaccharide assembly protein LptE/RlpB
MKRIITILAATILVLGLSGCATILKGNTQEIAFASDPAKAQVYINGSYFGETPFTMNLDSSNSYTVEFRKSGYQSKSFLINSEIGLGWVILDIVSGFYPVVIDAITGDWKVLDTTIVMTNLEKR